MQKLKKLFLMLGLLFVISTTIFAGNYYWVGVDGIIHSVGITAVDGTDPFTISTNTLITHDLTVDGNVTMYEIEVGSLTINDLLDMNNNRIVNSPNLDEIMDSTTTLRADLISEETARAAYDALLMAATMQLQIDLDQEILDRIYADSLIAGATDQLQTNIYNEETARILADSLLGEATGQIRNDFETEDVNIRYDFNESTNTLQNNIDNLESEVESSTNTLQGNIDAEESARIAEDLLLTGATEQLQVNIDNEETARINYDNLLTGATEELQNNINTLDSEVVDSTTTLQNNIDNEEAARITADALIGGATEQIRNDFESYDSLLNGSTEQLRTDLLAETINRINYDSLLDSATGQLQINIDNEENDRIYQDGLIADSTNQLQININNEETARINQDLLIAGATNTLQNNIDDLYFDVVDSTTSLQNNIDAEELARTNADILIGGATEQLYNDVTNSTDSLRTDLNQEISDRISEDNLLDGATEQLQVNINNEEAARINQDTLIAGATEQLQINIDNEETDRINYDNLLTGATEELQNNIDNEESARIATDYLIGAATDQIRSDFESYDSLLSGATTQINDDLLAETINRINADALIGAATEQLQNNIDAEETARINQDILIAGATDQLQTNIDNEETARINQDTLIAGATNILQNNIDNLDAEVVDSTTTLQNNIDAEELARINTDILIGGATEQLYVDITNSTDSLRTDLNQEISDRISGDNLLTGATEQLQINIDNEESARIAQDVLIAGATEQLQNNIDNLEAEVESSTNTLQGNIDAEETARINYDNLLTGATEVLQNNIDILDSEVVASTTSLQNNIDNEETARINADILIGAATEQIRNDFESYDSLLTGATEQLQINIDNEETARINYDSLLNDSTSQLRTDVDSKVSKSGDVMIGNLTVPILYANIVDATTGYFDYVYVTSKAYTVVVSTWVEIDYLYANIEDDITLMANLDVNNFRFFNSPDLVDIGTATDTIRTDFETEDASIRADFNSSTNTLQGNIDSEESARIAYDTLLRGDTTQIRIDFEYYDSLLNNSTSQIQVLLDQVVIDTGTFVLRSGDIMTGDLEVNGDCNLLGSVLISNDPDTSPQELRILDEDGIAQLILISSPTYFSQYVFAEGSTTTVTVVADLLQTNSNFSDAVLDENSLIIRVRKENGDISLFNSFNGNDYHNGLNIMDTNEVRVGSGTPTYTSGTGDLFVYKLLEVGSTAYLNNDTLVGSRLRVEGQTFLDHALYIIDSRSVVFGHNGVFGENDGNYSMGYNPTWGLIGFFQSANQSIAALRGGFDDNGIFFVATSSDTGRTYVSGSGDAYFEGLVEIDGQLRVDNQGVIAGYFSLGDNGRLTTGSGSDFSQGFYSADEEYRVVKGNDLSIDANVIYGISKSSYIFIGDPNESMSNMDGQGDLFVGDELFVDGTILKNNGVWDSNNGIQIYDGYTLRFKTSGTKYGMAYDAVNTEFRMFRGDDETVDANVAFSITPSTMCIIGIPGTINYADGQGDLVIGDDIEVKGDLFIEDKIQWENDVYIYEPNSNEMAFVVNGAVMLHLDHSLAQDMIYIGCGDDTDTVFRNAAAGDYSMIIEGSSGIVYISTTTDTANYVDGEGDGYIRNELEVGGNAYIKLDLKVEGNDIDIGDAGGFSGIKFNPSSTQIEFYIDGTPVGHIGTDGAYIDDIP